MGDLLFSECIINIYNGGEQYQRQKQEEQDIVAGSGHDIAVKKIMKGALRATARAEESSQPVKWTGRKKIPGGWINIKIQQRSGYRSYRPQ